MALVDQLVRRLVRYFPWLRRHRADSEIQRELDLHLALETQEHTEAGMSPDEARRVARLRLGNAPLIREDARAVWGWRWMDATAKDVRYAWRSLRRTPGFSAVVILTMGLGVGAVTAVYSIVDPLLLRPLPFREPTSLYKVLTVGRDGGYGAFVARDLARALRDQPQIFTSVGAFREESWTHDQPEPSLVEGAWVTPGLFPSLGVAPRLGRLFDREEWTADVALISARLWRVRFGARDDMLGQRLRLQHGTFTVVGVLPGDVRFPSPGIDVWLPLDLSSPERSRRVGVVARLRDDLSFDEGNERLRAVSPQIMVRQDRHLELQSLHWAGRGYVAQMPWVTGRRTALLLILGAVALTLLLTCANVASLGATRAILRRREFAVRSALGAGRVRLARQLLTESLVWAVCGSLVGLVVAFGAIDIIRRLVPSDLDALTFSLIRPDGRMLVFALLTAAFTGLVSGMLPVFYTVRQRDLATRSPGSGSGPGRSRHALLATQVALASVLTVGAGLMINSYARLMTVPIGVTMEGLIAAEPVVPDGPYADPIRKRLLVEQWVAAAAADPRVTGASITTVFPLHFHALYFDAPMTEESGPLPQDDYVSVGFVAANYFEVMAIPMVQGRTFGAQASVPRPVVVGQRLARQLWGEASAIGRRFKLGDDGPWSSWMTVVGVVGDVREIGYRIMENPLEIYLPVSADSQPDLGIVYVVARGNESAAVAKALEQHLWAIAPEVPLRVHRGEEILRDSAADTRFQMTLFAGFSGLALLLAVGGIYSVVSRVVSDRTQEIGVRVAIGARPFDIITLVLRREFIVTLGGLLLGLAVALGASRLMSSMLFEVAPADPVTFGTVAAVFLVCAALACVVPSRRALTVDPATELRAE